MLKKLLAVLVPAVIGVSSMAGVVAADPEPIVIIGTGGRDVLVGTVRNDVIFGLGGNDLMGGRRGDDIMRGGPGNDDLRGVLPTGHSGHDVLRGGRGIDRCVGDAGDVFISCEVVIVR